MPGKSTLPAGGSSDPGKRAHTGRVRARRRLRTVRETSAGGLVVDHVTDATCGVLIGRTDRRGELEWVLPKGHVEAGETTEQTAVREVREETGLESRVVASLGDIDYWFVADNRRIHKTVHHYVLEVVGGTIGSDDVEVSEVAWVPIDELDRRLRYPSERRLLGRLGDVVHRRIVAGPS